MALLAATGGAAAASPAPADLELVELASGLPRPVAVADPADGSGRLLIASQLGEILVWEDGSIRETPFLDLRGTTEVPTPALPETGLLGLALDPGFATNGRFYVSFTEGPADRRSRVVRYRVSEGDPNVADPSSALPIFEIAQPEGGHNGGHVLFGPDGYLYLGLGDGGAVQDADDHGQDPASLLGKMLRIDVDAVDARGAAPSGSAGTERCGTLPGYGIPPDNPFAGPDGICDEIWAIGLRNPWRFSFDRASGDLLIGDVGALAREEIDFEPAGSGGRNYGWSCREGFLDQGFNECLPGPLVDPLLDYGRIDGCAVVGGHRYRGRGIAGLGGTYVYGDWCTGRIWLARLDGAGALVELVEWRNTALNISSFGEDAAGELYVLGTGSLDAATGTLHRFASPSSVFTDGFERGDLSSWDDHGPP